MCTVSFFRYANGYHIYMNRDERHDREAELPPQILDDTHGIMAPLDPQSGGTWIAHNKAGYWGCVLNGYMAEDMVSPLKSRGLLLTELLATPDPIEAMRQLDASAYASFRLVIGSPSEHHVYVWDGMHYGAQGCVSSYQDRAFFLSSSSWKQDEVIALRAQMFDTYMQANPDAGASVPDFHTSKAPALESAPLMYRSYSRTQSITAMHVSGAGSTMEYWPVPEDVARDPNAEFTL